MNKRDKQRDVGRPVDPMFDGHLEKPLSEMTDAERLHWAWQGAQLLHWARRAKDIEPDRKNREGGDAGT